MARGTGISANKNEQGEIVSWKVDVTHEGKRITSTAYSREDAELKYQELKRAMILGLPIKEKKKDWKLVDAFNSVWDEHWQYDKSSKTSLINYKTCEDFFGKNILLKDLDEELIDEFIEHCKIEHQLANSTINRKLASLSKVLKQAKNKNKLDRKPYIPFFKEDGSRERVLSKEEEAVFLKQASEWNLNTIHDFSVLLADGGLRPYEEALNLLGTDINLHTNTILVRGVHSKNSKPRTIFMTERLRPLIETRVKLLKSKKDKLFDDLTKYSYIHYFKKIKRAIGLSKDDTFVPYTFRHTCCTRMAEDNVNLLKMQLWMGHKSIQTTMRYAHLGTMNLIDCAKALEK